MKLTKSEKNELSSSLKIFGENSQSLSSEFIKLLRLSIVQQDKATEEREKIIVSLDERHADIFNEINAIEPGDVALVNSARLKMEKVKSEMDWLKKEQDEAKNNMVVFNEAIAALKKYTDSFKSDFLSSLSIINNAEIDNDAK